MSNQSIRRLEEWQPPRPIGTLSGQEERCRRAKEQKFLSHNVLSGVPGCKWNDFRNPLLRRFDLQSDIRWDRYLGGGLDGCVWRVEIHDLVFALKVFWDVDAPPGLRYWALQRECQNVAILQMIQAAASTGEIYLNPDPKTHQDAVNNLKAFSDEGRHRQKFRQLKNSKLQFLPRIRKCFGWVEINASDIYSQAKELCPKRVVLNDGTTRGLNRDQKYYAIVYEFVPQEKSQFDESLVQSQLDFFWLSGFCLAPVLRPENWGGAGVLLDIADIICPWHAGWFRRCFKQRKASEVISAHS